MVSIKQRLAVLRDARALIIDGWCRNDFYKLIGGQAHYCATGAVIKSVTPRIPNQPLVTAAIDSLRDTIAYTNVQDWNDSQRSKEPIIQAFDMTIARLEGKL